MVPLVEGVVVVRHRTIIMGVFSSVFCVFDRKMISSPLLALRLLLLLLLLHGHQRGAERLMHISVSQNQWLMLFVQLLNFFCNSVSYKYRSRGLKIARRAWKAVLARSVWKNNIPAFPLLSNYGHPSAKKSTQVLPLTPFQPQHPRCRRTSRQSLAVRYLPPWCQANNLGPWSVANLGTVAIGLNHGQYVFPHGQRGLS